MACISISLWELNIKGKLENIAFCNSLLSMSGLKSTNVARSKDEKTRKSKTYEVERGIKQ